MRVLLTGAAGFIGYHVAQALLGRGAAVVGIDNLTSYYDVALKQARLDRLAINQNFSFHKISVADKEAVMEFAEGSFTHIVHLAAQAGVRYSLENPYAYAESNLLGQVVMLELARRMPGLEHFVYASSSSVYGGNIKIPFSIDDNVARPVSLYAATKVADELMSYSYAHLFQIPMTGLRFFTVYGPWGRPDMAAYLFARNILKDQPITVFNHGKLRRDFTYIDDIVDGVVSAITHKPPIHKEYPPTALYNLGNSESVDLMRFIAVLEKALGKKAIINFAPMQSGDVVETLADIQTSIRDLGFCPKVKIEEGLPIFVKWFKAYHNL